jgi:hypothetical protein
MKYSGLLNKLRWLGGFYIGLFIDTYWKFEFHS